jgi:FkbM family methyltransferase
MMYVRSYLAPEPALRRNPESSLSCFGVRPDGSTADRDVMSQLLSNLLGTVSRNYRFFGRLTFGHKEQPQIVLMKRRVLDVLRSLLIRQGYKLVRAPRALASLPEGDLVLDFDHVIKGFLSDLETPSDFFFVQVGAFDGVAGDPIHGFVKQYGWKGVLVEPQHEAFETLKANYEESPGLRFENAAISTESGTKDLFRVSSSDSNSPAWVGQVASFDRGNVEKHARKWQLGEIQSVKVNAISFTDLAQKHRIDVIDLLQIDTEGFDFEVIKMVDFDRLPPAIIHYEHCHLGKANAEASFRFLIERGYRVSVGETDTIALKARRSA